MKDQLLSKIHDHTAVVAMIGLGYVGLPLAVAFAEKGFPVVGVDVDGRKVAALNRGESYVQDISSARLACVALTADRRPLTTASDHLPSAVRGHLVATPDFGVLTQCDAAIIAVPTPLSKTRDPDMKYVLAAGKAVAQYVHPGMLVVLESTTYPGTTEELLLPMLVEGSRLKVGEHLFVAFSPERIDPGNKRWVVENTPKVVGGVTPACLGVAAALYGQIIERIVPVSSTQAAEMVKLLENTFRAVNIALVNETAIMCDKLGIDVWEVIDAAATKPYGFMRFTPGPGVGGHCLDGKETVRYRWGSENGVITLETLYQRVQARGLRTLDHLGGSFVAPTGLEVLSVDLATGEQTWRRVTYLFEREYTGTMVEVVTADNRRLTVTDRHPMLVHTTGGLAVRDAVALSAGDLLPLVHGPAAASAEGEPPRLHAEKLRYVSGRCPRAEAPYALAQVKQVIARADQTRVYSVEVAGTHTFAATSGIYVHNCIPLDPHYLSWKLKTLNYNARFIQLAGEINSDMPRYWVAKVVDALNEAGKPLKGSNVLMLGVAYKKDIGDLRESPALDVIELLRAKGADVRYHDPYVPTVSHNGYEIQGEPDLDVALVAADCVIVVTDHSSYDWAAIREKARLMVDTRNAMDQALKRMA